MRFLGYMSSWSRTSYSPSAVSGSYDTQRNKSHEEFQLPFCRSWYHLCLTCSCGLKARIAAFSGYIMWNCWKGRSMSDECLKKIVPVNILEKLGFFWKRCSFPLGLQWCIFLLFQLILICIPSTSFFQLIFTSVNRIIVRIFFSVVAHSPFSRGAKLFFFLPQ